MLLRMTGICKSYPGVLALDHVDFELEEGEVHVLLGENGAGKSTLVKVMSGACQADAGSLSLEDKELDLHSPSDGLKAGIAVIYQEFSLVPHLSVAENIALGREPGRLGWISSSLQKQICLRALERIELELDPRRLVTSLSVAERQMVEIARALNRESRVLVMDEPTSALAAREIETLFGLIKRLQKKGVGIVFISHRMEELFEIGTRVTVLRDGKNVGSRNIHETDSAELIRLMVNRRVDEHYPARSSRPGAVILEVHDLSSASGLRGINLRLHQGEVLGIAGLMGSGRTELARSLFGVDARSGGTVRVGETPLDSGAGPSESIRAGLAFLTEDRQGEGLVLCLSVGHNLSLPNLDQVSRWGWIFRDRERRLADEAFSRLRIRARGPDQKVLGLSGGNQQKVVFGKWLARHSRVLILDEPTRGIDVGSKAEIYQTINQLVGAGLGILLISSDLPELLGLSDRILVLRESHPVGEFSAHQLTPESLLSLCVGEKSDAA